jgi:hypothetical protein
MNLRTSFPFAAALLVAVAAVACSSAPTTPSDNTRTDGNKPTTGNSNNPSASSSSGNAPGKNDKPATDPTDDHEDENFLAPEAINTGFVLDPDAGIDSPVFKVPLYTDLKGDLKWVVADPTLAEIKPIPPPKDYEEAKKSEPNIPDLQFAILTAKKPGNSTVTVSGGGKTAKSTLTIKSYTPEAYAVGKTRYKTGEGTDNRRPCASCHEKPDGADHSPFAIASFDDDDVLNAIQTAVYAKDKYVVNNGNHKWNLKDNEKEGIMAYLRGLPPKGF